VLALDDEGEERAHLERVPLVLELWFLELVVVIELGSRFFLDIGVFTVGAGTVREAVGRHREGVLVSVVFVRIEN